MLLVFLVLSETACSDTTAASLHVLRAPGDWKSTAVWSRGLQSLSVSYSLKCAQTKRLCAELGISMAEYEMDEPLRRLVQQLDQLQQQQAQAHALQQRHEVAMPCSTPKHAKTDIYHHSAARDLVRSAGASWTPILQGAHACARSDFCRAAQAHRLFHRVTDRVQPRPVQRLLRLHQLHSHPRSASAPPACHT
jgi:hypothetical protein